MLDFDDPHLVDTRSRHPVSLVVEIGIEVSCYFLEFIIDSAIIGFHLGKSVWTSKDPLAASIS